MTDVGTSALRPEFPENIGRVCDAVSLPLDQRVLMKVAVQWTVPTPERIIMPGLPAGLSPPPRRLDWLHRWAESRASPGLQGASSGTEHGSVNSS